MRHIVIVSCILWSCASSSQALAQKCKPHASETDKLSKEKYDIWANVLSSKGGVLSTSNSTIGGYAWRRGHRNYIVLSFQKREASAVNASFESAIRGAVGQRFYFGFKNGDPLKFEMTEVENDAGVSQGLFSATGVTTVWFRAVVSDRALALLREALTSRQIDAVRIELAGDARIEASVDDKHGKKMMGAFSCFYQSLDKMGIDLSAAVDPPSPLGQSASTGESKPRRPATEITIDQVIQMVTAKLSDDLIITTIQNSTSNFELTPEVLVKLKTAGVSDRVIRAIIR